MSRGRHNTGRKQHNASTQQQPQPAVAHDAYDIFEERPRERRSSSLEQGRELQQQQHNRDEHNRSRQHRRQILVELFSDRHRELAEDEDVDDAEFYAEDEPINEKDFCWYWDEETKSNDVLIQNCGTEVYFHPDYSCGTAAIRGDRQFREGEEHYWEIQMSSAVYGTDMMIGVGSASVDLNKYKSQFCSIIGKDPESWGVSYFGTLHHNGKTKDYTKKFERGAVIGCHLDLWKGTLSFYKNGEPLGIAFDGLLGKKLYPIISSTAARTRMKLLCSYKTSFSLQYLCCKEISKHIPASNTEILDSLPIPNGLKRYIGWRMDWVLKLNNPRSTKSIGPRRKRLRSDCLDESYKVHVTDVNVTKCNARRTSVNNRLQH